MTDIDLGKVKEAVRRHWEGRAATFDDSPSHGLLDDAQRAAWARRVSGWSGQGSIDALDVGCGTGFFALLLAGLGHRPVGVDMSEAMLELARAKAAAQGHQVEFRLADAERLPFLDASYDLVIERHVIWTLPDPDGALRDWARILRPGGRLILVEGDWRSTGNPDYAPIRDSLPLYGGRPAPELEVRALANGFAATEVEPLMGAELWVDPPDTDRYAVIARR